MCEYVTLNGKRNFAHGIKDLEVKRLFLIIWEDNVIIRVPIRGSHRGQNQRKTCNNGSRGQSDTGP